MFNARFDITSMIHFDCEMIVAISSVTNRDHNHHMVPRFMIVGITENPKVYGVIHQLIINYSTR